MRATIKGLSFDEWPRDFDNSYVITPGGLTGWLSGATMRRDETARPSAHGAFDAPGYLPARVIGIEGTILASSDDVLDRMILQLTGLLADGSTGRLTVQDDHGNATWADVRLASCEVDRNPSGTEADYQIQFWAPNPRRYGERRTFASGSAVFHRGNFPASVTAVIPSAPSSYTITSPAGTFTVSGATAGGTHRWDSATGRVTRDGVLMLGVGSGLTWAVPAAAQWTHTISAGGSIEIADTYM